MSEPNGQDQIEYEKRLRRRIEILKEEFKEGRVRIPRDSQAAESLLAVRYGPDGEVDLDTVDGFVRSLALGVTHFHDRKELKDSVSLTDIQNTYFEFIESNFQQFFDAMSDKGLTPHDAGMSLVQNEDYVKFLDEGYEDFIGSIHKFWNQAGEAGQIHIEDLVDCVKGVFGGDLFPSPNEDIASKCGLYVDTLVLPDPFIRSSYVFPTLSPKDRAYMITKCTLPASVRHIGLISKGHILDTSRA